MTRPVEHDTTVTPARNGKWIAECSCGTLFDVSTTQAVADRTADIHRKEIAMLRKMRVGRRKTQGGEA